MTIRKLSTGKRIMLLMAIITMAFSMTACSMMHDDRDHCMQELRLAFKYDMNMKFANAFANQVKTLTLHVYDEEGKLAFKRTELVANIEERGGYMTLDGLKPGKYTIEVWAEGEQRQAGSYVYGIDDSSNDIHQLDCRIARKGRDIDHDLTPLYHGLITNADLTMATYGIKTLTVPLTKDTNNIRIVLQNASGQALHASDFTFSIEDDNTWLAYDNTPVATDSVTYHPWAQYDGTTNTSTHDDTQMAAIVAEMTVDRLFTSKRPRLIVRDNERGKTVFSIPLIDYALLVKGRYNQDMDDQEYLDRQDEYDFVFFIDDSHNWLNASIIVNSWRVVLQHTNL